jgi:anion-transporting  ArsA/GET3 family ATPase
LSLLDRRLLFVTGKGGVGKTTISAALGLLAASQGKRTLVCETDGSGHLGRLVETGPLEFAPREVQPSLWAMTMSTEASLKEYLALQLKLPLVARLGPLARAFDFIANAAPGVREILTIGKVGWEVKEDHYDLVIVDAPATGHVLGQLRAPQAINELLSVGLVREQTDWLVALLADAAVTGVVIVTAPEEMPVVEALELVARLAEPDVDVDLAAVVVNRVLPELFGRGEEEAFDRLCEPAVSAALAAVAGPGAGQVLDAARLAVTLRRNRAEHLAKLRAGLDRSLPMLYVPELFARTHGIRAMRQVADRLGEEL